MIPEKGKSIRSSPGQDDQISLRLKAEAQLTHSQPTEAQGRSADKLLHELQVYQIELEMQNEELRRAQILVEESRDRYVELYEFAPVGYLALSGDGMIEEINLTGAALLGAERSKLIHRRFALFVAAEDSNLWQQHFKRAKQTFDKQSSELALKRSDGSIFFARLESQHIEDAVSSVRIALSDITERKRIENEIMERRREMAELHTLHVAAQTVAAIAHELNQPLLAIASYSEAALMLMKDPQPKLDKIQKAIEGCERQALRAGQSILELLKFLSVEEFPTDTFDLNHQILDVLNISKLEHELRFDTILRFEEKLPLVLANRAHVQKVFLNLLHNAIEAMREAGVSQPAITVTTIRTKIDKNVAQITMQDNGPGVKKEHLQRLFEPFFSTKSKGIGMGLAISRSLIEENGGQLWVDQKEGSGAAFHLTLPFAA